jgi:hypothetical protein
LDQKETQKILTDYNSKTHMSSLHVGLKQRKKKEKRGGVRENAFRAKEEAEAEDKKQHR